MTQEKDSSGRKAGLTRRTVIGTLAAAVLPALRNTAKAQTLRELPRPIGIAPVKLALPSAPLTARVGHSATLLESGLLLVVGGQQFTAAPLSGAQVFDPESGEWFTAASLKVSRQTHAAALLPDGRVLVCGGVHAGGRAMAGCEIYDPQSNIWRAAAPLNVARYGHTATPLPNGTVLVVGGCGTRPIAGCEIYLPAQNVWTILPSSANKPATGLTE